MDEGRSLPDQLDFLELLYLLHCALLTLVDPFPHRISWVPLLSGLLNLLWDFGTSSLQWRWINGVQRLCLATEHLISLGMSRAPVPLYPSQKTVEVISVNWMVFEGASHLYYVWPRLGLKDLAVSHPSVLLRMKVCFLGVQGTSPAGVM